MAIDLNDNTRVLAPKPSDPRYFADDNTPWDSIVALNAGLPIGERHEGLTVNVAEVEYWWKDGAWELKTEVIPLFSSDNPIYAWGDSITFGTSGQSYPNYLSILSGKTIINKGYPGETSKQLADRILLDKQIFKNPTILWLGRNDVASPLSVLNNINIVVNALGHENFIILSVLNRNDTATEFIGGSVYNSIIFVNNKLAERYPNNYFDMRAHLVSEYNPSLPQDVIDFSNDCPPTSLISDGLHPNAAGLLKISEKLNTAPLFNIIVPSDLSLITNNSKALYSPSLDFTTVKTGGLMNIGNFIYGSGLTSYDIDSNVSAGKIGFGTKIIYHPFQINGNIKIGGNVTTQQEGALILGDDQTANANLGIYRGGFGTIAGGGNVLNLAGRTGVNISVGTGQFGTNSSQFMVSTTGVGIGTTTPRHSAQINSILKISDDATQQTGQLVLGDGLTTARNVGVYRGSQGGVGGGNWLNITGHSGIALQAGTAGLGNNTSQVTISTTGVSLTVPITTTQFRLSALNTAPASATATGTLGEIRYDANYMYLCVATNTWKRSPLTTW